ncbi:MAG: sodium-dependent phosphate transporter [Phycisphaerae bacterium]|nr:Na/Pi cotransporter family protein [Phycisphaerae bacterium]NIP53846.1 Na/Pi cotransporter family protein [Phycisphaerae bacterium]NIS52795.1 Na/Pi cotransporter family protein [Phycisphaerae bacterium]NIU10207.1 Na/Pi cotransporter family protein [Phycisphaerae bacterium]NIU57965.1 sodium-dependent phosphate transporter [Phycisphaerae bacterium]
MAKDMIFYTVGGLGLFLFGMGMMCDGLKNIAGHKLKKLLESLTKNRVVAVMVGALTTCLIQSSSATTVMTVGLVNAGLLTLKQALCVVLGANIGTTFTAWLVSVFALFKITNYALPFVGVGFLLSIAGRTQREKSIGEVLLGLGILFVGMFFMKEAFAPLKDHQGVREALIWLGHNPILAVLAGTLITMLLQSSSASIAVIQILALQGAFGTEWDVVLRVTIPYILGDNIGTTITAWLAALRASRNSKRTAMGHTMFNVIGVLYVLPLVWIGWFADIVEWVAPSKLSQTTIMMYIAVAHSTFNVFNTLVFLPIVQWLEMIVMKLIPVTKEELARQPVALEEHLLNTPVLALEQTKSEIIRMALTAKKALRRSIDSILEDDGKKLASVREIEDFIDELQYEITSYLSALSRKQLSDEVSVELPVLLHTVNDLERIGDHAVNIVEIAQRKIDQKLTFSDSAVEEAGRLRKEVEQMLDYVIEALENNDVEAARAALVNEANLNKMQIDFRRSHVQRMTEGVCTSGAGLIFIDLVDNIEKIGDHLTNIAQAVIGGLQWDGVELEEPPTL